jgi:D-amino-acid dehydrogenase
MKQIIIVGGGVIGLCVAWYCREKGHAVTVLERGPADGDCCSLGNAGLIVPSHIVPLAAPGMVSMGLKMMCNPESPFYIKPRLDPGLLNWGWKFMRASTQQHVERSAPLLRDLNFASKQLFEDFASLPEMEFGYTRKGLLNLCKSPERLHEETELAHFAKRLGMAADVLLPDEARRLDPGIDLDIAGAVYFPDDAHLSPNHFMACLTRLLLSRGAQIRYDAEVIGWEHVSGRVTGLHLRTGRVVGDEYVIAGGAWSPSLARPLGLKLPMQPGKGYSLTVAKPPQLPQVSYILMEARVAVTPMLGAVRFGGTMELSGLDLTIHPGRVRAIARSAEQYLPAFRPAVFDDARPWSGLRPCSPDGLPYVGRPERFSNLAIATGHAMMGLSLGPITGKIVAEILNEEEPHFDLSQLHPDRWSRRIV